MTFTPERTWVNQRVQIGAESTIGTSVPANKILECFDWTFQINADLQQFTPTGHKYPTVQQENTEWVDGTLGGTLDYNGVIYPLGGVMGSVTPTNHGSSTTAKDWVYTPPVFGSVAPQTYTVQQGDSTHAHQTSYTLFTDFGYKSDRKTVTVTGKMFGQPLSDGITLTNSPTPVSLAPVVSKNFNVYLDTASGSLGTTQLNRVLQLDYNMTGTYQYFWAHNRSTVGYSGHVDLAPKTAIKLLMEADTNGMTELSNMQSQTTYFIRIQAQGTQIASDGPGAVYNTFTHDLAVKVGKPSAFQNKDGIFAIEWEFLVVEDPTWAKSQTITVTNLLTSY